MAQEKPNKKNIQLNIEDYAKVKEQRTKSKLKIVFPWPMKIFFIFPLVYFLFLLIYYVVYLRFLAEH